MTIHKKIDITKAPKAIGPYSQAIKAGDFLFISGMIPLNLLTGKIVEGDIQAQTKQVLSHIESILQSEHLTLEHVVKVEVFLKDFQDFQIMNQIYAEKFHFPIQPARVTIQAARLPLDALIEISCTAYYLT